MNHILRITTFCLILTAFISCGDKEKANKLAAPEPEVVKAPVIKKEIIFDNMDFVMGKFDPQLDSNFVWIDTLYTDKKYIYLQRETYEQFLKMRAHAQMDGIDLKILSATRNFNYQKGIWERKWRKLLAAGKTDQKEIAAEILLYSAMPGTSRHHWGTDIDLNYLGNSWFESGKGQKIYEWLLQHAHSYGFCQPYSVKDDQRPNGYEEEKWHWSYMPLAEKYYKGAAHFLKDDMISGFSGAESAVDLKVVDNFVLGVHPACK